jgi:hypothetical protein
MNKSNFFSLLSLVTFGDQQGLHTKYLVEEGSDSINHLLNGGKRLMSNTGTTGRIPLWLVGMVVGMQSSV